MNRELFEDIFRDANVLDIDFSIWDHLISWVIVAREATAFPKRKLPIYVVEFQRVRRIEISFAHYGIHPDFGHMQWDVYGATIDGHEGSYSIRLRATQKFPATVIECEDVNIKGLEIDLLNKRFPGWSKPGTPFVRPGLEELLKEEVRRE